MKDEFNACAYHRWYSRINENLPFERCRRCRYLQGYGESDVDYLKQQLGYKKLKFKYPVRER